MPKINYRLYASLLIMGLCPALYSTLRIYFLGQMPDASAYSIAGQLSWLNLIYEVVQESIILPLYFFLGQVVADRAAFANRVRSGLLLSAGLYTALAAVIWIWAKPLLQWMEASPNFLDASAAYIRIECIANIFGVLSSFTLVALVTLGREKYLYLFTAARLVLSVVSDILLVSALPFSLQLGVNGIGYSNLLVNGLLFAVALALLAREGIPIVGGGKLNFSWLRELGKVGGLSGFESFVRNAAYMVMVVRMVNVVQEQGIYWVANGFIWSWLLLPVTQLGELIKQEIATGPETMRRRAGGYFKLTAVICGLWILSIPLWKPFMANVLGYVDVDRLFQLVIILLGFYVVYAFQNVGDSMFYGLGKTQYLLFQSVVTNAVYYGGAFLLYQMGLWTPSLTGIALMFGCGMAFDAAASFGAYWYFCRKENRRAISPAA